jgi:SPP1 gp7 family putative phage head morphogenesis protein
MNDIEKAILARRQRDLDNFTIKYQDELQNWAGDFAKKLLPSWKSMEGKLNIKIKDLYKRMGAITDPEKLKALRYETSRLESLAAQLVADIKQVEATYQPAYTGALKYQFEKAYYGTAYGLEQAAQMAVTVPVLTPTQILGVTANPWVGDAANYATRLKINSATLASSVKMAVLEAVKEGKPWDETARRISQLSGEGYRGAVRIARTELTRAAALGSSMLYMQNADVLDGKRWNATLDSRTAPKDAHNDGKIYDLDYDTPENPGTAGQRIPNHPNCRCVWSPTLSALGPNEGERIGRGEGDTPSNFGQRQYFS